MSAAVKERTGMHRELRALDVIDGGPSSGSHERLPLLAFGQEPHHGERRACAIQTPTAAPPNPSHTRTFSPDAARESNARATWPVVSPVL